MRGAGQHYVPGQIRILCLSPWVIVSAWKRACVMCSPVAADIVCQSRRAWPISYQRTMRGASKKTNKQQSTERYRDRVESSCEDVTGDIKCCPFVADTVKPDFSSMLLDS